MIAVRDRTEADTAWVRDLFIRRWGGEKMVTRGVVYDPLAMPALVAEREGVRCGLATWRRDGDDVELLSLDAEPLHLGAGSALLTGLIERARATGCRRIWLITSNDNLDALRFYQRRDFQLVRVHRDAITEARKIKPSIPLRGDYQIPIRDELELELELGL